MGEGFTCPDCLSVGSLNITYTLDLGGDSRSDEITLQIVACSNCPFRGVAVYEESRRGALDAESWDHYGYRLDPESLDSLSGIMTSCPNPSDASCQCAAHRAFTLVDASGRWNALDGLGIQAQFPMRLDDR